MALAAAAVMSCSESEEIENAGQKAEIKLGTVVGNTTRATVTDLPELQKVGFTVYAYNTGATAMASVATFDAMKEFMAAVKVTYSAPDWSLTGGTYYWPMTDNLQFFAYGNPGTGALTYNQPAAGAIYPSITYTVADVAAQTDLVAAKATDATKASNASGVSLKFGHILTQINFTVKAADALTYKLKTLTTPCTPFTFSKDSTSTFDTFFNVNLKRVIQFVTDSIFSVPPIFFTTSLAIVSYLFIISSCFLINFKIGTIIFQFLIYVD